MVGIDLNYVGMGVFFPFLHDMSMVICMSNEANVSFAGLTFNHVIISKFILSPSAPALGNVCACVTVDQYGFECACMCAYVRLLVSMDLNVRACVRT